MGSSSSGFFRRPRLMNLASSAGVMPLWGIVVFGVCPQPGQGLPRMVLLLSDERQGAAPPKQGLRE